MAQPEDDPLEMAVAAQNAVVSLFMLLVRNGAIPAAIANELLEEVIEHFPGENFQESARGLLPEALVAAATDGRR